MTSGVMYAEHSKRSTPDGRDTHGGNGGAVGDLDDQRRGRGGTEGAPRGPAKVIQLPLWPELKRGAPNAVLRGALFAAVQGKGPPVHAAPGANRGSTTVSLSVTPGMQLDQADLDVWEQVLHLARTQALGTECHFTARRLSQGPRPPSERAIAARNGSSRAIARLACVGGSKSLTVVGLTSAR